MELTDGRKLPYDKLLLTTGTRVRKLHCPGADLPGVHYLRDIADVDGLQAVFQAGTRIAIVGGGYIGLEVAAVGAKRGLDVTVFEAMDRLMARAVSPPLSDFYAAEHEKAGVKLKLQHRRRSLRRQRQGRAGDAPAARAYAADIVLVGIGVMPNDELARACRACLRRTASSWTSNAMTGDPAIFAAGDCTRHIGREGIAIRLECVQNAIDQAKHAALAMVGRPKTYSEVPWFWSDQYDLKLQIAGLARPTDQTGAARRSGLPQIRRLPSARRRGGGGGGGQCRAGISDRQETDRRWRDDRAGEAGRSLHPHEADGADAAAKPKVTYHRSTTASRTHGRGGRRLVADGRRGRSTWSPASTPIAAAPAPAPPARSMSIRPGRRRCRPKPTWKKRCWISRQVVAPDQPAVLPAARDARPGRPGRPRPRVPALSQSADE